MQVSELETRFQVFSVNTRTKFMLNFRSLKISKLMNSQLFGLKGFEIFIGRKLRKINFCFLKTNQNNNIIRIFNALIIQKNF